METTLPKLRTATLDDLEALMQLEERAFTSDRFSRPQYRYLLTRANATPLVVTIAVAPGQTETIAGTAFMLWRRQSRQGHLYTIAVDPDFHGQGIGKQLLLACEAEARRRGCDRIALEVRQDNESAIALYKKHGYEVTERMRQYYEDQSDAYKMVKLL
jgi:ribosomal-protein-alanine acetyltransferase